MSAESPTLPNVQVLDVDFLGSFAVSSFVGALETGVIIALFMRFLARSEAENIYVKLMVSLVTFVAFFQTGVTFAVWWKISVLDFGDWSSAAIPAWPQKVHSNLTTLIATPVQLFFVWRCWYLLKRRWFVALPLISMVLGSVVTSSLVLVILFRIQFKTTDTPSLLLDSFFTCFALSLAFSAALDIAVTGILLVFLIRSRSDVYTRRFRRILSQLIVITWESAIPPCTCALAALITCLRGAPFVSYWAVALQTILGKLYLISLFVTLNGRASLAEAANLTHFPTLTDQHHGSLSHPPYHSSNETPTKLLHPFMTSSTSRGTPVTQSDGDTGRSSPGAPQIV
ncbi:hypothetical protein BC834DRAFT_290537 [Gloeopeniophorella convolvens]|nr:hypothetical protein BC834DRAFT_290537 [Gloeopeniophorella convolvens]